MDDDWLPWLLLAALVAAGLYFFWWLPRKAAEAHSALSWKDKLASGICQAEAAIVSEGQIRNSSESCDQFVKAAKPYALDAFHSVQSFSEKYDYPAKLPGSRWVNPVAIIWDGGKAIASIF